jgi:hypothetical protein
MSSDETSYHGSCYCGAVTVSVEGDPAASGYCHCTSCRKWHSAPVNAFSMWPADKVSISGDYITSDKDAGSQRITCSKCGGCVANGKPDFGMMAIYAMTLDGSGAKFEPMGHLFYPERVMEVNDGLPKFADMPAPFGGSGDVIEETGNTGWR